MNTSPNDSQASETARAESGGEQKLPLILHDRGDGSAPARGLSPQELSDVIRSGTGTLWVHVDSGVRQQVAVLDRLFAFHPLAVEDVLNPVSRPKVDQYDNYLFVTLRSIAFREATPDPYDVETTNLYLFVGPTWLVTAHAGPSPVIDHLHDLCVRTPDLLSRGAARMAHQVMDAAVDAFFPVLDRIDEFIDSLEDRVFRSFDEESLRDIFAVKRLVLSFRRYVAPQREIFNILSNRPSPLLPPDVQIYFRDVYDHMLRINDSLDTYRDLLGSTMESYLSQVSNRLNQVTKALSVVATLSVPFVVVSGMWGMNFVRVPLAQNPWGFEIMLAVQLLAGGFLIAFLRWRRWF
ncbi:MAG: magnesium transporter CorA family protein [Gemmatimonadota bacterium]